MSEPCGLPHPEHPDWTCILDAGPTHPAYHDPGNGQGWVDQTERARRLASRPTPPATKAERRRRTMALAGRTPDRVSDPGAKEHAEPQDTEHQAMLSTLPRSGTQRRRVYDALRVAGDRGLTDEEIQVSLQMNPSTVRPRRGELVEGGFASDSGQRRQVVSGEMAIVWIARGDS